MGKTFVDRWLSQEYDWFFLDSGERNYVFYVPTNGVGDAGDCLNTWNSPVNGKSFMTDASILCVTTFGPGWYNGVESCCYCRFFSQSSNNGFAWSVGLQTSRMMVRQIE